MKNIKKLNAKYIGRTRLQREFNDRVKKSYLLLFVCLFIFASSIILFAFNFSHKINICLFVSAFLTLLLYSAVMYWGIIRYIRKKLLIIEASHKILERNAIDAHVDPLTLIGNRRAAINYLEDVFIEFKEFNESPIIVMLDIDYFKKINDIFGHHAGDLVLIKIADIISGFIKETDRVFRWAGDEFVVVIYSFNKSDEIAVVEKLLKQISHTVLEIDEHYIQVEMSAGMTIFNNKDRNYMNALTRADAAMYQSKEKGRNLVSKA